MHAGKPAAGKSASRQGSKPGGKAEAVPADPLPEATSVPRACVGDLEAAAALWVQRWAEHAEPSTCAAAVHAATFERSGCVFVAQKHPHQLGQVLSTE